MEDSHSKVASANELAELKDLAKRKIELMKASALKKFLGIVDDNELENFKIKMTFFSFSYNNTKQGKKYSGGERYKRAVTTFENFSNNWRELDVVTNYYVPSGYGDGNVNELRMSYLLTDSDIAEIKEHGSRLFLVSKFSIKDDLDHENDVPYKTH